MVFFIFRVASGSGPQRGYDSVYSTDSTRSYILCVHGKNAKVCCQVQNSQDNIQGELSTRTIDLSHCHTRDTGEGVDKHARKRLIFASVLCLLFMVAEIIGGYLANSLAIATDAAHLLTDLVSFMISLFALWIGSRAPTRRMSWGWYRAEVIG